MLKINLLFKKNTNFTVNNSRILTIKNVKFPGYYFYMIYNIWGDFQICISVPLSLIGDKGASFVQRCEKMYF